LVVVVLICEHFLNFDYYHESSDAMQITHLHFLTDIVRKLQSNGILT